MILDHLDYKKKNEEFVILNEWRTKGDRMVELWAPKVGKSNRLWKITI